MLIKARLPFLPAEGEYMTAGFMVGFSQWGADLLPGQSTSVKTASACTHMHSTHQRKKKRKIKGDTGGATNMMTKCIQVATGKRN